MATLGTPVIDALVQLLVGAPQPAPSSSMAIPSRPTHQVAPIAPPPADPRFPDEMMPPPDRPATLPGGSFAPGAAQPSPAAAIPPPVVPQQGGVPGPLAGILGGKDFRQIIRAFGAGAGARPGSSGDPWAAGLAGFGGATGYYGDQEAAAAKAAIDAEKTDYQRQQEADKLRRDEERDARDFEMRKVADARAAKTSELQNQKTSMEIKRDARSNGITISQQLELERIAQAAGENIINPEERKRVIDETRERLVKEITGGAGISRASTGLSPSAPTATGPNGEKLILKNGQWEPM